MGETTDVDILTRPKLRKKFLAHGYIVPRFASSPFIRHRATPVSRGITVRKPPHSMPAKHAAKHGRSSGDDDTVSSSKCRQTSHLSSGRRVGWRLVERFARLVLGVFPRFSISARRTGRVIFAVSPASPSATRGHRSGNFVAWNSSKKPNRARTACAVGGRARSNSITEKFRGQATNQDQRIREKR